jgi:hypothetical protein
LATGLLINLYVDEIVLKAFDQEPSPPAPSAAGGGDTGSFERSSPAAPRGQPTRPSTDVTSKRTPIVGSQFPSGPHVARTWPAPINIGAIVPIHRRTAMKVRDGRVLKKNNWRLDAGDYRTLPQDEIRLDRRKPPYGSRHLITIAQLRRFIALLPDWDEVAVGLDAIVLDSATDCAGWCGPGVVAICAWDHDLWDWWPAKMVQEHDHILNQLDVDRVPIEQSDEYRETSEQLARLGVRLTKPIGGRRAALDGVSGTRVPALAHSPSRAWPSSRPHHHSGRS